MKKISLLFSVFAFLLVSCSHETEIEKNFESAENTTQEVKFSFNKAEFSNYENQTRSMGDNSYDVLGYGYNAFEGFMKSPEGVHGKVIDVDRLVTGQGIDPNTGEEVALSTGGAHTVALPSNAKVTEAFADNLFNFSTGMSFNVGFSLDSLNLSFPHWPKLPTINLSDIPYLGQISSLIPFIKLPELNLDLQGMVGDVANILPWGKIHFNAGAGFQLDHTKGNIHHELEVLIETKRIFFEDYGSLKYFLTPSFKRALKELSGEEIINTYGTHIITDFILGSRLNINSTLKSRKIDDKVVAKFGAGLFELIKGDADLNLKFFKDFTSININFTQEGGGIVKSIPSIDAKGKDYLDKEIFDYKEWVESIKPENSVLVRGNTVDAVPIISLVDDPGIKAKIKLAILKKAAELDKKSKPIRAFFVDEESGGRFQVIAGLSANGRIYDAFTNVDPKSGKNRYFVAGPGVNGMSLYPHIIASDLPVNLSATNYEVITNPKSGLVTIFSTSLRKFYCKDRTFKTAAEDVDNLRFWTPIYQIYNEEAYKSSDGGRLQN